MLRWVTPIKNMNRTTTREVELEGQVMAEGDRVLLVYPSANRDESVFDEPFRFDIGRSPNEHVAFGFGSHFCLGNSLARLELRVMIDRLLDRLPDLRLADEITDEAQLDRREANFITGYERLPVVFTPTAPLAASG
jgi:cytochrome P450 family 142 subfamily A polypeptide 1